MSGGICTLSKAGPLPLHPSPCCPASPPLGISHRPSLPRFTWSILLPSRVLPCCSLNEPQNHDSSDLGTLVTCPASLTLHGAAELLHWTQGKDNLAPKAPVQHMQSSFFWNNSRDGAFYSFIRSTRNYWAPTYSGAATVAGTGDSAVTTMNLLPALRKLTIY